MRANIKYYDFGMYSPPTFGILDVKETETVRRKGFGDEREHIMRKTATEEAIPYFQN